MQRVILFMMGLGLLYIYTLKDKRFAVGPTARQKCNALTWKNVLSNINVI